MILSMRFKRLYIEMKTREKHNQKHGVRGKKREELKDSRRK